MQQITDLRRQTAATAAAPLGLSTWWPHVWAEQVSILGAIAGFLAEKLDISLHQHIQDQVPGSATFGQMSGTFLAGPGHPAHVLPDPFWSGPI